MPTWETTTWIAVGVSALAAAAPRCLDRAPRPPSPRGRRGRPRADVAPSEAWEEVRRERAASTRARSELHWLRRLAEVGAVGLARGLAAARPRVGRRPGRVRRGACSSSRRPTASRSWPPTASPRRSPRASCPACLRAAARRARSRLGLPLHRGGGGPRRVPPARRARAPGARRRTAAASARWPSSGGASSAR